MISPENELILIHRFLCHSSEVLKTVLIKLACKNVQICVRGAGITSEFVEPADCTWGKAEERRGSVKSTIRPACQKPRPCSLSMPTGLVTPRTERPDAYFCLHTDCWVMKSPEDKWSLILVSGWHVTRTLQWNMLSFLQTEGSNQWRLHRLIINGPAEILFHDCIYVLLVWLSVSTITKKDLAWKKPETEWVLVLNHAVIINKNICIIRKYYYSVYL